MTVVEGIVDSEGVIRVSSNIGAAKIGFSVARLAHGHEDPDLPGRQPLTPVEDAGRHAAPDCYFQLQRIGLDQQGLGP